MSASPESAPGFAHRLCTEEGGDADVEFRIGLSPIPLEQWFEGGEADPAPRKDAIFAEHPALSWGETDGSRAAQKELAGLVADWARTSGRACAVDPDLPPLRAAARLVSDDLCLMERRPRTEGGSDWTLTAVSLCAPSFFSVEDVLGHPLDAIHGPVPTFNDRFLPRVSRIFDHLAPDVILTRRNWSLVPTDVLFIPSADGLRSELPLMEAETIAARLRVRRERQTIRKLPRTGAVIFSIRIWLEPFAELLADPSRRHAFARAWERLETDAGDVMRSYKHLGLFDGAVRLMLADAGITPPAP